MRGLGKEYYVRETIKCLQSLKISFIDSKNFFHANITSLFLIKHLRLVLIETRGLRIKKKPTTGL